MSTQPDDIDPTIDEAASLWAARLDGSVLSAADRTALDEWLAGAPARRARLSQYCQFSADLEQRLPMLEGIKEEFADVPVPKTAQPHPWSRRPLMVGAMLTAAAAVAVGVWLAQPRLQVASFTTPAAQRDDLMLADGTRVVLNAQTSLQVTIGRNERRVRLAAGEAFFAVHKDAGRPFIVETPAGSVRVTGTKFAVRSEAADALEVTVVEGSVQARPGNAGGRPATPVQLVAGDRLSAGPGGAVSVQTLSAGDLDDALAWRQGQVVFAGVPLQTALARFARYHGRGITATPEAAALRVGARFSLDDLDGFFSYLELALPVSVTHDLSGNVQVSMRPAR